MTNAEEEDSSTIWVRRPDGVTQYGSSNKPGPDGNEDVSPYPYNLG